MSMKKKTLVLGGARSGKSRYAENLAEQSAKPVIYVATATAGDEEMKIRIEQHKHQRPTSWQLVEESLNLAEVLKQLDAQAACIMVDCLTLWLSNCLAEDETRIQSRMNDLIDVISNLNSEIILVSNEVGQGVVPMGELSRRFVDESGRLHQRLAQVCDRVVFTIAGLPQILK